MTQSIREVARTMPIRFDESVLQIAEEMERRNAAIARDFAAAWGGVAVQGELQGTPDTDAERIVHEALLQDAASQLGHAAIPQVA